MDGMEMIQTMACGSNLEPQKFLFWVSVNSLLATTQSCSSQRSV